jgi:(S)-ureidoglycine aminohydrolase
MKSRSVNKKRINGYLLLVIVPLVLAAGKVISSSFVNWEKVSVVKSHTGWTRHLMKSQTRSLDMLEIEAMTLHPGKITHTYLVDRQNDELYFIKEGAAAVSINNITRNLGEGDIAFASQENRVTISNKGSTELVYYSIRLKPKYIKPSGKTSKKGRTFFATIDTIKYESTIEGTRYNIYNRTSSTFDNLDIHFITLKTDFNGREPDTHKAEEIVLIRKGFVFGSIKEKHYRLGQGSIIFLTDEDPVDISNGGESGCEYYVIRWLAWNPEAKK